jgi:hypothetical protein
LTVSGGEVWAALVGHGEWGDVSGGLVRFNPRTGRVKRWALHDRIADLQRIGGKIVAATDFGVAIVDGDRIDRYFVDRSPNGEARVLRADR